MTVDENEKVTIRVCDSDGLDDDLNALPAAQFDPENSRFPGKICGNPCFGPIAVRGAGQGDASRFTRCARARSDGLIRRAGTVS